MLAKFNMMNVVIGLFLVNALFWGLGSHSQHCALANKVGVRCLSHNIHLMMGVVFFLGTMTLVHRRHMSQYVPLLNKLN